MNIGVFRVSVNGSYRIKNILINRINRLRLIIEYYEFLKLKEKKYNLMI